MPAEPVLVVDDNALNLELAQAMLELDGYEVRTASDAHEALGILASGFRPRLVLMDIQLPGMDGLDLTRHLRADPAFRDLTIIALTAYAMVGDQQRILAAGCDGYIAKPIDTRSFSARIRAAIDGKGPAGAAAWTGGAVRG